jgi:hypothetical protein
MFSEKSPLSFEPVKVFLGVDGIIYIMGISHETIAKLISAEYEKSGVKGEQYARIKRLNQPKKRALGVGD